MWLFLLKLYFYMFYRKFPAGQYSMIHQSLLIIASMIEDTMPLWSSMKHKAWTWYLPSHLVVEKNPPLEV